MHDVSTKSYMSMSIYKGYVTISAMSPWFASRFGRILNNTSATKGSWFEMKIPIMANYYCQKIILWMSRNHFREQDLTDIALV